MYDNYPTYNLDLDSLKEFAELRCLRILSDMAEDKRKAFAEPPVKVEWPFCWSGKFECPYVPLIYTKE